MLTLVHPDFLPPVYSMAQVLSNKNYSVDILTFVSAAPGNFFAGEKIHTHVVASHSGSAAERAAARKQYEAKVTSYIEAENPKAIFTYCEFSYLTALKYHKNIPIFHFALELINFSYLQLLKSPFGAVRTWKASHNLHKAAFLSTPSYERSGWLAGRYDLVHIPDTVQNTPFIPAGYQFKTEMSALLPEHFKNKVRILNTGGVNHTRSVIELVQGFEKTSHDTCLIVTNIGNSDYANEIKKIVGASNRKDDILLLGTVSREELVILQASCPIGICLMKLENGFDARMIAPNKVGEYFMSGALVLGMNTPYFQQFIPYKTAHLLSDLRPESIAEGLEQLSGQVKNTDYRQNILTCLKEWYNMEIQMEKVLKMLEII